MNRDHMWTFNGFHGQSVCETCNRIVAFNAIRRAAKLARKHDTEAEFLRNIGAHPMSAPTHEVQASTIRHAIRAAIGSPKA